jgi:hypothetical protein
MATKFPVDAAQRTRMIGIAIAAWTDLEDLTTCVRLATVMWVPTVAAWAGARNRWYPRSWRSIDVAVLVLAVAGAIGAVNHAATLTQAGRIGVSRTRHVYAVPIVLLAHLMVRTLPSGEGAAARRRAGMRLGSP